MDLPTLDFSLFTKGTEKEKQECARQIVDSFSKHGFVKLTNHGLPEETVKAYMKAVSSPKSVPDASAPKVYDEC